MLRGKVKGKWSGRSASWAGWSWFRRDLTLSSSGNSRHKVQIGEVRWIEDYPAPWDFFGTLLSCHAFLPDNPANLNDSEYCKHPIEAQFQRALAARSPNAAGTLWADIDRKIVGQAPWVPLYNPRAMVVVSARVGNYQFHPLWRLLIDQLWVR